MSDVHQCLGNLFLSRFLLSQRVLSHLRNVLSVSANLFIFLHRLLLIQWHDWVLSEYEVGILLAWHLNQLKWLCNHHLRALVGLHRQKFKLLILLDTYTAIILLLLNFWHNRNFLCKRTLFFLTFYSLILLRLHIFRGLSLRVEAFACKCDVQL